MAPLPHPLCWMQRTARPWAAASRAGPPGNGCWPPPTAAAIPLTPARQAQAAADAAERAALNGSRAATSASRAESAALRAESFAPEDGTLLSVNGKGGAVVLDAQDVGALPAPVAPQAGALLRVLSIRSDGSLVVDTVTPAALKTLLEAT